MYIGKALVVYCDGGNFRKNPGPSGCGLYWYLYNNENPNKFPMTNIVATSKGLMDKKNTKLVEFPTINTKEEFIEVVKEKVYYNVNVLSMHEYAKGFNGEASNNLAEVRGLTKALEVMLNEKPDYTVIYSDSEYVIRGLSVLDKMEKANWLMPSGKPIANFEQWQLVKQHYDEIRSLGLKFELQWIKGHGDAINSKSQSNLPNLFADNMASIAASLSNNLAYLDTDSELQREITIEELEKEKKPNKIHPFLVNKRMYFPYGGRTNPNVYFIGSPGAITRSKDDPPIDIFTGKNISDAQQAVIYLSHSDPVINMLEDIQSTWLKQHYKHTNLMYCLLMDSVADTKTYQSLEKYGKYYVSRPRGVPNLETIKGKELTYVHDPVFLAARNIEHMNELYQTLELYQSNSPILLKTDITHLFYNTTEMTIEKTLDGKENVVKPLGKTIAKTFIDDSTLIKASLPFGQDDFLPNPVEKEIILTCGVDIPRRNQLKSIETEFPLVEFISWHYSGGIYRYAVVISTFEKTDKTNVRLKNYGIWRGTHASQILLNI